MIYGIGHSAKTILWPIIGQKYNLQPNDDGFYLVHWRPYTFSDSAELRMCDWSVMFENWGIDPRVPDAQPSSEYRFLYQKIVADGKRPKGWQTGTSNCSTLL